MYGRLKCPNKLIMAGADVGIADEADQIALIHAAKKVTKE